MRFENADFDALAASWKRFYPERYAVSASLLRQNTVECPVFDWGASRIHAPDGPIEGFVVVKKSPSPSLYAGADPDQAHISAIAFEDPVVGVDILAETKRLLRNRGVYRLVFGQDCRHFFPGCPEECSNLRDFLRVEGFEETVSSFDLERDLADYEPPNGLLDPKDGIEMRRLTKKDKPALDRFLREEFPGRWHYDTMGKLEQEGRAEFVMGLFEEGRLCGFAVTQDAEHRLPLAGAVWQGDLGDTWGTMGPIGVGRAVRGRSLGHALLAFALCDLKYRGVRRCLIDWTTLDKFYGRHGFEISRRYTGMALRLDA
jgi:predicted N-acetyltransferase YhbS